MPDFAAWFWVGYLLIGAVLSAVVVVTVHRNRHTREARETLSDPVFSVVSWVVVVLLGVTLLWPFLVPYSVWKARKDG